MANAIIQEMIAQKMEDVKYKILVLSSRGGVGKSTICSQLAYGLASRDLEVGILDLDFCNPSIPQMLGLKGEEIQNLCSGWSPVYADVNIGAMSKGFKFRTGSYDEAEIWMNGSKDKMTELFLTKTYWNKVDILLIDTPSGSNDELISLVQFLGVNGLNGVIIVTTPQSGCQGVCRSLSFCNEYGLKNVGVVENMSGCLPLPITDFQFMKNKDSQQQDITELILDHLQQKEELVNLTVHQKELVPQCRASEICSFRQIEFLGSIPLDCYLQRATTEGKSCFEDEKCSFSATALKGIIEKCLAFVFLSELN